MCIHIEESFPHAYSLSLSLFFSLSCFLSLSFSHSLARPFFDSLCRSLLPPPTHARHNTTSTRGTHSSHVHCTHDQWREKPTPHVRRGFESQSGHVSRLAHNVRSCNGHVWSHLLAESTSEGARIRSASFAS